MDEKSIFESDLKYIYQLTLSLARPGAAFSEEDQLALQEGVKEYNLKSIYMTNPKKLEILGVGDSYIRLKLFSTQVLTTPGRGLRMLTTILINGSSRFKDRVTPGGQLFRVVGIQWPAREENTLMDPELISDADFLKALIDYIIVEKKDNSTSVQRKKAAVQEMKKLAVDARIISDVVQGSEDSI